MPQSVVHGNAWTFGSDIDTDTIIPSQYMRLPPEEYAEHAMEPLDPDFASRVSDGDIIVARKNFGIGSSREQAVVALKRCGIGAVVAESFARTFFRNAVNEGLPVIQCESSTAAAVSSGDELEITVFDGVIRNLTTDEEYTFEPFDEPVRSILEAGGAVEYYKSTESR